MTITHPSFWGTNTEDKLLAKHRADCHSPQISGITTEEKIASLAHAIKSGDISFGIHEQAELMERLGY